VKQDFFGKNKWVKTRKHHICFGCNGSIPPGEQAHYSSGVYEGDFGDQYMHEECYEDWENSGSEEIGCGDIDACVAVRDRIRAYIESRSQAIA
jgi:hypothetical protein